jgi:hypothetical protein
LQFIREDRVVFAELARRLPPELQAYARSYHYRRHAVKQVHYLVRCLAAGRVRDAREVLAEARREGSVVRAFLLWAATGNGRWFQPRPVYVEPAAAARAPST